MKDGAISGWGGRGISIVLALLVFMLAPGLALAGGVAVVVDTPLPDPEAGKVFTIGFLVRSAHEDKTPIGELRPVVILTHPATDERVTETARADGEPGHYVAQVTLPAAGEWRWTIQPFGITEPAMAASQQPLKVRAPGEAPATKAETPAGPVVDIAMADSIYEPRELTIAAGTTVTWTNKGKLPHTATDAQGRFSSGNVDAGGAFAHTFTEPGTYQYYCEYHAPRPQANGGRTGLMSPSRTVLRGGGGHMIGKITVTAAESAGAGGAQAVAAAPAAPDNKLANVVAAEAPAQGAAEAGQGLPATGGSGTGALVLLAAMVLAAGVGLALRRRAGMGGR